MDTTILKIFRDAWSASPYTFENLEYRSALDPSKNLIEGDENFCLLEVSRGVRTAIELGENPTKRQMGHLTLRAYSGTGTGPSPVRRLGDAFAAIFEHKNIQGIRFRWFAELPPYHDRGWFVVPFQITFEYDI